MNHYRFFPMNTVAYSITSHHHYHPPHLLLHRGVLPHHCQKLPPQIPPHHHLSLHLDVDKEKWMYSLTKLALIFFPIVLRFTH